MHKKGAVRQRDYPYTNNQGECRDGDMPEKLFHLEFPGFSRVGKSLTEFKAALRVEAINVSFAVGEDFWFYKSGIYKGNFCSQTLNHAMVAVGFGVGEESGTEYAIIRN